MKSQKLLTLAMCMLLFVFAADSAFARGYSRGRGRGITPRPPIKIHAGGATIESVDSSSITVKSGHGTQTYAIDGHTSILVANKKSSAGALQKGMNVSVRPSTLNPSVAQSIDVPNTTIHKTESNQAAATKKPSTKKKR